MNENYPQQSPFSAPESAQALAGPYADGGHSVERDKARQSVIQLTISTLAIATLAILANFRAAIADDEYMYTLFSISSDTGDTLNIVMIVGLGVFAPALVAVAGFMSSLGVSARRAFAFAGAGAFVALIAWGVYAYFARLYWGISIPNVAEFEGMTWGGGMFLFFGTAAVGLILSIVIAFKLRDLESWGAPSEAQA